MHPIEIYQPTADSLAITWQGGSESRLSTGQLRAACPCSECRWRADAASATFQPLLGSNAATIREINLVGSSALHVTWADGHSAGIYPYTLIRQIAPPKEPTT